MRRHLPVIENAFKGGGIPVIAGVLARAPADLDVAFWKALRKRETPYALLVTPLTDQ